MRIKKLTFNCYCQALRVIRSDVHLGSIEIDVDPCRGDNISVLIRAKESLKESEWTMST